jgi:hypothetical protein
MDAQMSLLFAEPLNPVAPKAQAKVPVPEGLDLDARIHPEEEEEEEEVVESDEDCKSANEDQEREIQSKKKKKARDKADWGDDNYSRFLVLSLAPSCNNFRALHRIHLTKCETARINLQ